MANEVSLRRLLGFQDFFPEEHPQPKEYYASYADKELIETYCCLFLSYFRHKAVPPIPQLLKDWFTFMGSPHFSSPSYWYVFDKYTKICDKYPDQVHSLLSEEALLNLFLWAKSNTNIPNKIDSIDVSVMFNMFCLNLLFNDDLLDNFQKAEDSANRHKTKVRQRWFLAISFPQNDIINVDYAQLMYSQLYKLLLLLDFLETTPAYQLLFQHLLDDFLCIDKEEFLKAIGAAVFIPFKARTPGWTALTVKSPVNIEKSKYFLDKLALNDADASTDQNDYLILRDKPFQKLANGDFRVIFDLFLIKKLYNGIIFKLSDYSNKDEKLMKGFLGKIRSEFSEAVLLYDTISKILQPAATSIVTGNEFKANGLDREPDFYARIDNNVVLFESKDFYIPGASKLSYDFDIIEAELKKDGRLGKAVKQLKCNIERTITKQLILDIDYDPKQVKIYPVIIVHDSLYSSPSLNYWVNLWLSEEISSLRTANTFSGFDFSRIMPVTLVEIDTLILYLGHLQKMQLDFLALLDRYHRHVKLDQQEDEASDSIPQSVLPFSEFVREYGYSIGITLTIDSLEAQLEKFKSE